MTTTITLTVRLIVEYSENITKKELAEKAYWMLQPMISEASADPSSYGMDGCQIPEFYITKNSD